jgi:hypothetical protein
MAVREVTEILGMRPGESLTYHVGVLCIDRGLDKKTDAQRRVHETANIAWKLMEQGKVFLTQRRLGKDLFEYIVTRASRFPTPAAE